MPTRPAPRLATVAIGRAQPLVARDSHPSPMSRSRNSGCSASVSLPGGSVGARVTAPSAPWSATTAENTPSRRARSQDTSINFLFEPPRARRCPTQFRSAAAPPGPPDRAVRSEPPASYALSRRCPRRASPLSLARPTAPLVLHHRR
ncbi:uncharacterized protein M6B38_323080 [Iris pallida]|uniref:Uncharacterized protein n=1 Tax=Iris pallida TaxID=29817 RepID=A0AAX6HAY9_IRIPA|nr:uncharacterized protein M6B38_323080 [Iris pallida]